MTPEVHAEISIRAVLPCPLTQMRMAVVNWLRCWLGGCAPQEDRFVSDAGQPHTCERLAAILQAEGHPSHSYGIGRRGKYLDRAFVLDRWSNHWVVYYSEHGAKADIRKHVSEDDDLRPCWSCLSA